MQYHITSTSVDFNRFRYECSNTFLQRSFLPFWSVVLLNNISTICFLQILFSYELLIGHYIWLKNLLHPPYCTKQAEIQRCRLFKFVFSDNLKEIFWSYWIFKYYLFNILHKMMGFVSVLETCWHSITFSSSAVRYVDLVLRLFVLL